MIYIRFDKTSYTVDEDVGSISPLLKLDRPSPCCISVLVELTERTATGEFGVVIIETFDIRVCVCVCSSGPAGYARI